ncbi:M48 family metallopeptidase [Marivirga sp. S37H4]|uniref:M48 family metallopeptidase n=1 Tax=Marivirga aurantiaca TaxID=2802615 RepID=A0A934WYA4_9BACT|nr:M48 family metallopeptidase [Marivirga aurantiaca]MBK6265036.1 M48 family metallopeptidase [Marivirga aurantiaca]
MKIFSRFLILAAVFIAFWLGLAEVNWMQMFRVEEATDSMEEKLTEIVKESIERSEEIIKDKEITSVIDSIVHKIAKKNYIDEDRLNVLIVQNSQVNAFALPDNHLVIYTGLINACDNPEALSGVIAHEMAHIQLNHVMKKLVKEVGISVLFSMTSNGGGEVLREVSRTLTSSAYDRSLEEEADQKALLYLLNANIDPRPLADFFYQLSLEEPDFASKLGWLSTHPDSKERAEKIINDLENQMKQFKPVLSEQSWKSLQENIEKRKETL